MKPAADRTEVSLTVLVGTLSTGILATGNRPSCTTMGTANLSASVLGLAGQRAALPGAAGVQVVILVALALASVVILWGWYQSRPEKLDS